MIKFKKWLLWGLGSLFVLLLLILLLLPVLIDSSFIKRNIQNAVARKNAGNIDYREAGLSYAPVPHLTIQKFDFSAPDGATARIKTLTIYPELLPLFRGKVRFSRIVLDSPEFAAVVSDDPEKKKDSGEETETFDPAELLIQSISPLAAYSSGLIVSIDQGYFIRGKGGPREFLIKDMDLTAGLTLTAPRAFNARLNINKALIAIKRDGQTTVIKCDGLQAALNVDENQLGLVLQELNLAQPAMSVSGRFAASPDTDGFSFDLNGKDLDVKAVRATALSLGGDDETVRDIFSYVKGGRIPVIRVASRSTTLAGLGDPENLIIRGRMQNGEISIDDIGLNLTEVDGDAFIANGLLEVSGASARSGETSGHDGVLKIGLPEDNDAFSLDIILDADLQQVPLVLERTIDHEAFLAELSRIHDLKGRGKARLLLGDRLDDITTKLEISEINFKADYQRVPFPIIIRSGKLLFAENKVSMEDLDGNVGQSYFTDTFCDILWEKGLQVDIPAGQVNLDLGELYPWAASVDALKEAVSDIQALNGHLDVSAFALEIPPDVDAPSGQWEMSGTGEIKEVTVDVKDVPEPFHLSSGRILLSQNHLSFHNVSAQLMDGQCDLTGSLSGDIRRPDQVKISLNGDLGEKAVRFLSHAGNLPKAYVVHAPVKFVDTAIDWQSWDDFSFAGNIRFPEDARIFTEFQYQADDLRITRLDIQDRKSKAAITLDLNKNKIDLMFKGFLHNNTLNRIFIDEKLPDGWVKGDLRGSFVKGSLAESFMKGALEGANLKVPVAGSAPVFIDTFAFGAKDNRISVDQFSLSYEDNQVEVSGHVDRAADTFLLDLNASAGDLKWGVPEKTSGEPEVGAMESSADKFWAYPVAGTINLTADSFSMGGYTWRPVHAQISPDKGIIKIDVTQANLCGIATTGIAKVDGDILDLDFTGIAKDRDFFSDYKCLSKNRIEMSGLYSLDFKIKTRGATDELIHNAQGQFTYKSRNGVITQDKKLSRILEVVNFTEIVKGRIPNLNSEGFSYDKIEIEGNFSDSMMVLNKLFMDGKTLDLWGTGTVDLEQATLNVELLAAPFKTVDSAIKNIPGVNYLLAGNLVSIPVRVRGDLADPAVSMMAASDISSNFLDFAQRAIKSPVRLIQYWNPYDNPESE